MTDARSGRGSGSDLIHLSHHPNWVRLSVSACAVWFHFGKPPLSIRWVMVRDPQGEHAPVGRLCTEPTADPLSILEWFIQRWQLEVTFEEARSHLGVETQRQWSDKAIARTTPLLLGLFSWVTFLAHALFTKDPASFHPRQAAWYANPLPAFSDALALARQFLWTVYPHFHTSREEPDMLKTPKSLFDTFISTLSYSA